MQNEGWSAWIGGTVVGANGTPLGEVVDIYVDDETSEAEWATVAMSGGGDVRFVPLAGARADREHLVVAWDEHVVRNAPALPYDGALTEEDEEQLYRHYDLSPAYRRAAGGAPEFAEGSAAYASPAAAETEEAAVVRAEEELRVGKVQREAGRVRLRKWVETEHVSEVVPVSREEVRVERQPINAANVDQALAEAEIGEAEHEFVLHEEQVAAAKVTVPKERVRVEKSVVTENQPIEEALRKERVTVERDDGVL